LSETGRGRLGNKTMFGGEGVGRSCKYMRMRNTKIFNTAKKKNILGKKSGGGNQKKRIEHEGGGG